MVDTHSKNWKLDLRYGRTKTPFTHFTLIINGEILEADTEAGVAQGPCIMGLKVWATNEEEAVDVAYSVAKRLGFTVSGKIQFYLTEPHQPPSENPSAYGATFTPYER